MYMFASLLSHSQLSCTHEAHTYFWQRHMSSRYHVLWTGFMPPRYKYEGLSRDGHEIRLLQLEPGHANTTIRCRLRHVSISEAAQYETVSYCWGDQSKSALIEVENRSLAVPGSTAEVLRRFRLAVKPRTLWIDAVCIDQNNVHERSVQVTKMHQIYASATQNLIWLGQNDEDTEQAIQSMNELLPEVEEATDSFQTLPLSGGPNFYLHRISGLKQSFDAGPFLRLCSKPWFGRLWVVQEASLARSNICHCGPYSFDLHALLRVAKWIWTKREFVDLGLFANAQRVLSRAWRISDFADKQCGWFHHARSKGWFQDHEGGSESRGAECSPTHHMLTVLRNFACSQPIDHVFGLLGLYREFSGSELPVLLRPDYSKSVEDVFIDATRQAILEGQDLMPFHDIYHRSGHSEDEGGLALPSWVPQWHRPWNLEMDPTPLHRGFKASGEWTLSSIGSFGSGLKTITLEGIFVDGVEGARVDAATERFLDKSMTGLFLNEVEAMVKDYTAANDHLRASDRPNDPQTAIATTLCSEESAERELVTSDDLEGYGELKAYFTASKGHDKPDLSIKGAPPELRRAARYSEACWRACYRRKFFITAAGRIGIGPQTMEVGDVLVVLYGGEWPFVLRPCGEQYELVGLSYVYGTMGGQAVHEHEARVDKDVWFFVR